MTRRARAGLVVSVACLAIAMLPPTVRAPAIPAPAAPNVLIVMTDDQAFDTLPAMVGGPPMPRLQARLEDPREPWVRFSNAFVDTPLCCPSRASLLTGLTSVHTGVRTNDDGAAFDESATLATWLDDADYTTGLVGKYLNGYPWDRGPYVPAGWDRFVAKLNPALSTTYQGYPLIDQGNPVRVAPSSEGYATEVLADRALAFLRAAPAARPWFLLFTPPAPHAPWSPAPGDEGSLAGTAVPVPDLAAMNAMEGKPAWVRDLPPVSVADRERFGSQERRARETLRSVDRAIEALLGEVEARGELDRTIVVFLTDNGVAFGEHRWSGKRCPYGPCVRIPLAIRSPWASHAVVDEPVLNVDLAPTILDLVGGTVSVADPAVDGESLRPFLDRGAGSAEAPARPGVLLRYVGDERVPAWRSVRTADWAFIETSDGTRELYDLTGSLGPADPGELRNVADLPRYGAVRGSLEATLRALARAEPRRRSG